MKSKKNQKGGNSYYKVIWDIQAKNALKEIYLYYKQKSPQAANNVKTDILSSVKLLCNAFPKFSFDPDLGSPYRRLVVRHYRLVYLINEKKKEVYVLELFDGRQNPQKLIDRIKRL